MTGLLGMALANAAIVFGARCIVGDVAGRSPELSVTLFLLARLALISITVLVFGAASCLNPLALGLAGGAVVLLAVLRGVPRRFVPVWRVGRCAAVWLGGALALRVLLQTWFLSPFMADVVSYPLPKVAEWVRNADLWHGYGSDPRSWFPSGFELVEAWWVLFLHHDVLIEMAGVEFLALAGCAAASVATALGMERRTALLAGVIYASIPGMMIPSVACLNDPAVAALLVAATAFVLERVSWSWLGVVVGLGTGLKPTFLMALPGLFLVERWARTRGARRPGPGHPGAVGTLAALSLAAGLVWYVRNAVVHGSPIYPAGNAVYEPNSKVGISFSDLWQNVTALLNSRIDDRERACGEQLNYVAGWGLSAFAMGIPGALLAIRRREPIGILTGIYAVMACGVLTLVHPDPWNLRFILFFPLPLALGAADLARRMPSFQGPLIVSVLVSILGTVFTDNMTRNVFLRATRPDWRERSFLEEVAGDVPDNRVGSLGRISSLSYWLYRPDFSRDVVYLRPKDADDLVATMKRERLRALLAFAAPWSEGEREILDECLRRGLLQPLVGMWYVRPPD